MSCLYQVLLPVVGLFFFVAPHVAVVEAALVPSISHFKPEIEDYKLSGSNVYHIKFDKFDSIERNLEDCAAMTLRLHGMSFDFWAGDCYVNADRADGNHFLIESNRYSYYELKDLSSITKPDPTPNDDIRIRSATFNMGENKKTREQWELYLREFVDDINQDCSQFPLTPASENCFDIFALTLQEDWKSPKGYGGFGFGIAGILGDEWGYKVKQSGSTTPDVTGIHFTVRLFIFYRKIKFSNPTFNTADICLDSTICSKATVGISMALSSEVELIFMGSHFPLKKAKDGFKSWGYEAREKAARTSIDKVLKPLITSRERLVVWSGDFNYRRETPVDDLSEAVDDQMHHALAHDVFNFRDSYNNRNLNPYTFNEETLDFPPTCKLRPCYMNPVEERNRLQRYLSGFSSVKDYLIPKKEVIKEDEPQMGQCPKKRGRQSTADKDIYWYHSLRTPSHCDRILTHTTKGVSLAKGPYWDFGTTTTVQESDHNMVLADFSLPVLKRAPVKVRAVTFNMGENKKVRKEWKSNLQQFAAEDDCAKPFSRSDCFDILGLTLQEDYRDPNGFGGFGLEVKELLGANWEMFSIKSQSAPDVSQFHFNVKQFVYMRKDKFVTPTVSTKEICLDTSFGFCFKATVGVSLNFPGNKQLTFMGSHLPLRKEFESVTWGYEERNTAISESIQKIYYPLRKSSNTAAIWAGDFNFRKHTRVSKTDPNDIADDQLTRTMEDGAFKVVGGSFQEETITFGPTCKMKVCTTNAACPNDRDGSNWLDAARTPSHCDRVLSFSSGTSILTQTDYFSYSDARAVKESDHNIVIADFTYTL